VLDMSDDRRTEKRVVVQTKVQVTGIDDSGLQFTERARLVDVDSLGCRFLVQNAIQQGGVVGIEPLGPVGEKLSDEFPRLFTIVWVKRKGDLLEVGARCLLEKDLSDGSFYARSCDTRASLE
jgi:hypothetical protein